VNLVAAALDGDRYALARLISLIEDRDPTAQDAMGALFPHTGRAHLIGVTGPPGSGKSTLVNALTQRIRKLGRTAGIIAVDPTSPFTGGALLGDRVRMRDLAGDPGVFVRSMATRGSLGGLAQATNDVVKVLDATGFDVVLIETVGAGQSEVEIAKTAHTTVVLEAPGMGDEVQALKAGLMEIADILVVNKADRPGAARTARALEMVINRNAPGDADGWQPPILQTIALDGSGVSELVQAIDDHRRYLCATGLLAERERRRIEKELLGVMERKLVDRLVSRLGRERLDEWVERVAAREVDVYTVASRLCGTD